MKSYENIIATLDVCVSAIAEVLTHPDEAVNHRRNQLEDSCDMLRSVNKDLQTLQDADAIKEKLGLARS